MTPPLLEVRGLSIRFPASTGEFPAVDDVSFEVAEGETLALVGESGCGKTVTALSLVDLLPPPGYVAAGEVLLRGREGGVRELRTLDRRTMRRIRGGEIALVFQDPGDALNPVLTAGRQVAEVVRAHRGGTWAAARREAVRLLRRVAIPEPERRASWYPHAFSGGQQQRIMIAIALAGRPRVLVADEPTTALDATVQARIAALVDTLRRDTGMGVVWITHDLALAARVADRIAVMYAGALVEVAPAGALLRGPRHPYAAALVQAARELHGPPRRRLTVLPGGPPARDEVPAAGCAFAPRCPRASQRCRSIRPRLEPGPTSAHGFACWHPLDGSDPGAA